MRQPHAEAALAAIRACAYHRHVLVYFDESGDYAFPKDRFDCYVQAALICPESRLSQVESYVAERQADWGVTELHVIADSRPTAGSLSIHRTQRVSVARQRD